MPFVPYPDVINVPDLAPSTPLGQMLRTAAELAHTVNTLVPGWAQPFPYLFFPAREGIKSLVQNPLPDPPLEIPVPGGQCCSTTYEVTTQYKVNGVTNTQVVQVTGKIGAPKIFEGVPGTLSAAVTYYACDGVERLILAWGNVSYQAYSDGLYTAPRVVAITPQFGGSNNCGDLLPYYPPTVPTADDLRIIEPIIIAPNVTVPIAFVYVRPEVDINVDADLNVNIPVTVNLPDININFNFDLGGINIQIGGGVGNYSPNKPIPPGSQDKPTIKPPSGDFDINSIKKRLNEIYKLSEDIKECACGEDTVVNFQDFAVESSGIFNLPANTIGCQLTLTSISKNNKNQDGGTAPDVQYSGWAWYRTSQGGLSERTPVDAAQKYFPYVENTTQFAYTLYTGNLAQLRVYFKQPVNP